MAGFNSLIWLCVPDSALPSLLHILSDASTAAQLNYSCSGPLCGTDVLLCPGKQLLRGAGQRVPSQKLDLRLLDWCLASVSTAWFLCLHACPQIVHVVTYVIGTIGSRYCSIGKY